MQKKEAEKKAAIARQKRLQRETRAEVRASLIPDILSLTLGQNRKMLAEQAQENARLVEQAYARDVGMLTIPVLDWVNH